MVFLDESGFLLVPTIIKTWSPKGKTPVLTMAGHWTKISAISAISVSPKRKRLGLHIRFHTNKNIKTQETIGFLWHLLKHLRGRIVLLWDRSAVHKAARLETFSGRIPASRFVASPGRRPTADYYGGISALEPKKLPGITPKSLYSLGIRQLKTGSGLMP